MKASIATFVFCAIGASAVTWLAVSYTPEITVMRLLATALWVLTAFTLLFILMDGNKLRRQKKANTRQTPDSDPEKDWRTNP